MTNVPARPGSPLSPRETEIAQLIAQGWTNAEIGGHIHIAENTVKSHLVRIAHKLGARNRAHIVVKAMEAGVAPLPEPVAPCGLRLVCVLPANHYGAHVAGVAQ